MSVERISGRKRAPMSLPLPLRLARTGLNGFSRISPPLTGRLTFRFFCTPFRHAEPPRETQVLRRAERFPIAFQDIHLAAYAWGQGPAVLLVHGWSGRGSQLGAFVEPLVGAGHRVIAFDLPAHGRTPGRRTNALVATEAVRRRRRHRSPVRALTTPALLSQPPARPPGEEGDCCDAVRGGGALSRKAGGRLGEGRGEGSERRSIKKQKALGF